jgi:GNAT superfamily N-acetyltransferase
MLTFRTFRNTDPPALATLWGSRAGLPGFAQPVTPCVLEQHILSKLYFDYGGLVLAHDDGRPVGFAHAGFGPRDEEDALSTEQGTTCLVLGPEGDESRVAEGLLDHCEDYLRRRGAAVLYGGGIRPLNPFYLGLYGGSELPGVLESDPAHRLFNSHGYEEIDRTLVLSRDLTAFEAPIDRRQMQIRRQMLVEVTNDPPARTWWDACVTTPFDLTRFDVRLRTGGPAVAHATFRTMDLEPTTAPSQAMGLIDLVVEESFRRRGVSVFLLTEAFRQFARQGVTRIDGQAMQHNVAALGVYRRLGFNQVDSGSVFRKGL